MTTLLGAADLAWMQDVQQQAMPGTVIISRLAGSVDAYGGVVETWAAIGTVVGRFYPASVSGQGSGGETEAANRLTADARWAVTLPVGTDVTTKDRVTVGGTVYYIKWVNRGEMWQTAVRCGVDSLE